MNAQDFNRLNGLLSKLSTAADKTAREDGSFRKYNSQSIEALHTFRTHLQQLENGLRTAKVIASPTLPRVASEISDKNESARLAV